MHVPANIRIDFTPGTGPGAVNATVSYVAPDGTLYDTGEPAPVKAGQSLTLGPIGVEVQLHTKAEHGDTPKKGVPAPKKPAAPAA